VLQLKFFNYSPHILTLRISLWWFFKTLLLLTSSPFSHRCLPYVVFILKFSSSSRIQRLRLPRIFSLLSPPCAVIVVLTLIANILLWWIMKFPVQILCYCDCSAFFWFCFVLIWLLLIFMFNWTGERFAPHLGEAFFFFSFQIIIIFLHVVSNHQ
jgi:hypothetical protein